MRSNFRGIQSPKDIRILSVKVEQNIVNLSLKLLKSLHLKIIKFEKKIILTNSKYTNGESRNRSVFRSDKHRFVLYEGSISIIIKTVYRLPEDIRNMMSYNQAVKLFFSKSRVFATP